MSQTASVSSNEPAARSPQRLRKPNHVALTEIAAANRQRDALYFLSEQLHRARSAEDVNDAAMDAIETALSCDRSAILLLDADGVMRFVGWHDVSDGYRAA